MSGYRQKSKPYQERRHQKIKNVMVVSCARKRVLRFMAFIVIHLATKDMTVRCMIPAVTMMTDPKCYA